MWLGAVSWSALALLAACNLEMASRSAGRPVAAARSHSAFVDGEV
jgi:hypothetical protein